MKKANTVKLCIAATDAHKDGMSIESSFEQKQLSRRQNMVKSDKDKQKQHNRKEVNELMLMERLDDDPRRLQRNGYQADLQQLVKFELKRVHSDCARAKLSSHGRCTVAGDGEEVAILKRQMKQLEQCFEYSNADDFKKN
uniref:Uncharacterized protein n=1 Tax=Spongospora subterranea TaxID=70186 RepID=A0A0H5QQ53_9EUKA|eukprot:CRZ04167.1 hypothetical protein [Spongospora subterranea]